MTGHVPSADDKDTPKGEGNDMAWYWWVLIVIAAVVIVWLKLKVLGNIMARREQSQAPEEDEV